MKKYIGWGHKPTVVATADVYVMENGETRPLQHHPRYSPDGFDWGNWAPGTLDVAIAVLWDVLGEEPKPALYQRFQTEIVSTWPMKEAVCWAMTDAGIRAWIADTQAHIELVLKSGYPTGGLKVRKAND